MKKFNKRILFLSFSFLILIGMISVVFAAYSFTKNISMQNDVAEIYKVKQYYLNYAYDVPENPIDEIRQTKLTILQRIISKCNPQKFVKNYDGEKVKSANDIYSKAINIKESDEVAIKELASRAENELCIHLVSPREIKALKELCNPKKFMQPYDPEKVKRANVLFGKLNKEYVSYSEYTEIKEDIDKLYKKMQNSQGL